MGHFSRNCPQRKPESGGRSTDKSKPFYAKHVHSEDRRAIDKPVLKAGELDGAGPKRPEPLDLLYSSSEEESDIRRVRVSDKGSESLYARVLIQGVPAYGLIDSGADITIICGDLFRRVATVARLRKRDFKKADKTPRTYGQKPFTLDGRMDLDITFGDLTMSTPVYIKMDAPDQLLLSEGVCRQLGIITYHPDVQKWRGGRKKVPTTASEKAKVPMVRVKLVQSIQLSPRQSAVVQVQVDTRGSNEPVYVEHDPHFEYETGLSVDDVLLQPSREGLAQMVVSNPTVYTQVTDRGAILGEVIVVANVVEPSKLEHDPTAHSDPSDLQPTDEHGPDEFEEVRRVDANKDLAARKQKLLEVVPEPELLDPVQRPRLDTFLSDHHQAFCLDELERGETDLLQFQIDTGDAVPKKQHARRMPFAVQQEVARQLKKMQASGVIQPSCSPWASPVVMVKKKDGPHRFCVDYRALNAVTKPDTFPLSRINDLLDQLGELKFFSTLDLASGYWPIRVHPASQEKTAFIMPQGLYEFRVMPFGLTNAPAVFQRLMQRVLMGLNAEDGPDFVTVYIDDVLVFSCTLEEHLEHLCRVIERLQEVGQKLKPTKCQFIHEEVE